jgi:hypothetical protein
LSYFHLISLAFFSSYLASSLFTVSLVGICLFCYLLYIGYLLLSNYTEQHISLTSLQTSLMSVLTTMTSLSLPADDIWKTMRYLISAWILMTCDVYPLMYTDETTFIPLNEIHFLLTTREYQTLESDRNHPTVSTPPGTRSHILLSWIYRYLQRASHTKDTSVLIKDLTNFRDLLPHPLSSLSRHHHIPLCLPSPLKLSLYLSTLLLSLYLHFLSLYFCSSDSYLSVILLILITLFFSLFSLLLYHLSLPIGRTIVSFPMLHLWNQSLQTSRIFLNHTLPSHSSTHSLWPCEDRVWAEEELERSRPYSHRRREEDGDEEDFPSRIVYEKEDELEL